MTQDCTLAKLANYINMKVPVFDNCQWCSIIHMATQYKVLLVHACVTRLKGVILFNKSLLSHLVQEPSSYVVPGLRYEGKAVFVNWRTLLGRPVAGLTLSIRLWVVKNWILRNFSAIRGWP